jgi:hypothetical protein
MRCGRAGSPPGISRNFNQLTVADPRIRRMARSCATA